jgi:ORF6N domain.
MELQVIQNRIYEIRGYRVMVDRDLAEMYGVETKVLNQSVKRNIERFPEDFMFQMTEDEFQNWKSQIVTSNFLKAMGLRKRPYVFTELGVAMLSSVLNSKTAIQINMSIMRAFVTVRALILSSPEDPITNLRDEIKEYIEDILVDQNEINEETRSQLEAISMSLAELQAENKILRQPRKIIKGFSS